MRTATVIKDVPALLVLASLVFAPGFLASAQSAAGEKTFEVASVRANRSRSNQTTMNRTANGVTIINLPLRAIIQFSYGISQPSRVVGGPGWIAIERFDIVARGTVNGLGDFRVMMQALLADRFKLAAHTEQRSKSPPNAAAWTLRIVSESGDAGQWNRVMPCRHHASRDLLVTHVRTPTRQADARRSIPGCQP